MQTIMEKGGASGRGFLEEVTSTPNQRRQEECDRWQVGRASQQDRGAWMEAPRTSHMPEFKILDLRVRWYLAFTTYSLHLLIFTQLAAAS